MSVLRVLMLVETVAESELLACELRRTGFAAVVHCITSEAAYLAALESPIDLILADIELPTLVATRALELLRASGQDVPIIVLAEPSGETAALACISLGAADFVFKDRPARLGTAVVRALRERELRVQARATELALRESAALNQAVLSSLTTHIAVLNATGVIVAVNHAWEHFARTNGDLHGLHTGVGINYLEICSTAAGATSAEALPVAQAIAAVLARELDQFTLEYPCHSPSEERWFSLRVTPLAGEYAGAVVAHENVTARRKADTTRALLATIVAASDDAIIGVALDGTVLSWNTGAEQLYGYRADHIIGQPIAILGPAQGQEETAQVYDHLGRDLISTHVETVRRHNDGRLIDVALTISAIIDADGAVSGFSTISRDISARKRAEDALRTAEAQYRTLVEQMPAIIYTAALDAHSTTQYVSPQIEAMLGFTPEEWLANPDVWLQQAHPDDRARLLETIGRVQTSDEVTPTEYRSYRRDGRLVWLRDIERVVFDAAGRPLFLQGISLDITESKQAEEALRRSEMRNQALINAVPDMMFRFDKTGVYLDCRANDVRDLVRSPADMIGKTIAEVLPPDLTHLFMTGIERALATGSAQEIEFVHVLNQSAREFEARIVMCSEDEVVMIVRNITERKQMERMKNEFVATVSHELRTPLTSIHGALGLIAGGVAGAMTPTMQRMVNIACTNSDRLIRLVNDILDSEKMGSGRMAFTFQPIELMPLVTQVIAANHAYGAQLNVTFALECTAHNLWVNVDSDRLVQALTNLLSNAAKFSSPGDMVQVQVRQVADLAQVAISDQGPGIPEVFRDQLFQKFAQVDASTTRAKGGTGLGLSITKAIIERLGGQITYAPTQVGATFVIDLPVWDTPNTFDALALSRRQASTAAPAAAVCTASNDAGTSL